MVVGEAHLRHLFLSPDPRIRSAVARLYGGSLHYNAHEEILGFDFSSVSPGGPCRKAAEWYLDQDSGLLIVERGEEDEEPMTVWFERNDVLEKDELGCVRRSRLCPGNRIYRSWGDSWQEALEKQVCGCKEDGPDNLLCAARWNALKVLWLRMKAGLITEDAFDIRMLAFNKDEPCRSVRAQARMRSKLTMSKNPGLKLAIKKAIEAKESKKQQRKRRK